MMFVILMTKEVLPTPYSLLPTPCTLLPTLYTLHPTPYSLLPTPYTLPCVRSITLRSRRYCPTLSLCSRACGTDLAYAAMHCA
eukprot:605454-Rhodomonas_salina.1